MCATFPDESRLSDEDEETIETARLRDGCAEEDKRCFLADLLIRAYLQQVRARPECLRDRGVIVTPRRCVFLERRRLKLLK